ncbi:MAG: cell division protein FtsZ [Chloroflexi bacterium]|nr:cell division protein FtsZ [Chloroflexota bacterium]
MIINNKNTSQQLNGQQPIIKVMGLGGAGCNTVNRMIALGLDHVEYIAANTDQQVLRNSKATRTILLGPELTKGLGAGGDPHIGKLAAEESFREIAAALEGADMVFLTAGMGGGTGTGAISIAARIAKSLNLLVIAFVTTPFSFEFGKRKHNADEGIAQLRPYTDTLVTIPNDKLLQVAPRDLALDMAFRLSDDALRMGIQGISELLSKPGLINIDAAHIFRLMEMGGGTYLSMGTGSGQQNVMQALTKALNHPMLESVPLEQAKGVIVNFHSGVTLGVEELSDALNLIKRSTADECEIITGVMLDEAMGNDCEIILIATGIGSTAVSDPDLAYIHHFGRPQDMEEQPVQEEQASAKFSRAPLEEEKEFLEVPAYLRNRQIPLELIEEEYGQTHLRSDLQPDL